MTTIEHDDGALVSDQILVLPVLGIGEIAEGHDLARVIGDAVAAQGGLVDGDVVVVTSKIVSKAEGRFRHDSTREAAIDDESFGNVARRGETRIVRTRHGFVMAAAGVDASNTPVGTVLLLPLDPDASARALRSALQERFALRIGVIISDTFGRPWRDGLTDAAIGAAGVTVLDDHRGRLDAQGRTLEQTITAAADEIAAAADLVKGKASGRPVAIVRGSGAVLAAHDHGPGATALVRPLAGDMFALGSTEARREGRREAVHLRRTVRSWTDASVDADVISSAVAAALTAPAPHHTTPWRFAHIADPATRQHLLTVMRERWRADLEADGFDSPAIERRLARGDLLATCPELIVPILITDGAHAYPDQRRRDAERAMFLLSMGAAVQSMLIDLAAHDLGAAWVSSTLFCADDVREALEWPASFEPMGAIALGHPATPSQPREPRNVAAFFSRY